MEYRKMGRTGLKDSAFCLGTMMFGKQVGEEESLRIIHKAIDEGVNFIDTADMYSNGVTEQIVGKAIKGKRDSLVLATKAGHLRRLGKKYGEQRIPGPFDLARPRPWVPWPGGEEVGYQSAYLANLTDKVYTIEIIRPLAERTRKVYDGLIERGYTEFKAISTKNADGYYGWEENAPFDKIIVTCGIDHIPPPLLKQLKVGGVMVIPVGPPGAQRILKVVKEQLPDGTINIARSDIYGGKIVPFVPFTKLEGETIKGTHNQQGSTPSPPGEGFFTAAGRPEARCRVRPAH